MPHTIIDAWAQHPTLSFLDDPMFDSLKRWTGKTWPTQELPIDLTLAAMDHAGVQRSLLSAWWGPRGPMITNDQVAAWVAQAPDRLSGICSVNVHRPMDAVRELRRCIKQLGMIGLRILPWLWGLPPDDRRYYPLYAECCELGVPFCLQVGHSGPLCASEPGRPIPYLDHVALEFPELTIVGGHIGYPWTDEMIALATKYENVFIDTSAYKTKRYPPALVAYMRGHGRHKVLFGSNYPMITPDACLRDLAQLELGGEVEELFLSRNAARVFDLPDS